MPSRRSRDLLSKATQKFSRRLRSSWQMFFLPAILLYSLTLLNHLFVAPAPRLTIFPYLKNIDIAILAVAAALLLGIFNMKRVYFARRFVRRTVEAALQKHPELSDEELIGKVFGEVRGKMMRVWLMGAAVVLLGVLYYWITLDGGNNLHVYFVVGAFSLLVNYPRNELFADIPWYVIEEHRHLDPSEEPPAGP